MHSTTLLNSSAELARLAVEQYDEQLQSRHSNIACISDAVKKAGEYVVAIYLKDTNSASIPTELAVSLPNGSKQIIETEIVSGIGEASPQLGQKTTKISASTSPDYYGSMCCLVKSTADPDFIGIVTSGHVMTEGVFLDSDGLLSDDDKNTALLNDNPDAQWYFQQMKSDQDLAIAEITNKDGVLDNYISFPQGFYTIQDSDVKTEEPNVCIVSRDNNSRDAFILDYNVSLEIDYDTPRFMRKLIFIGTKDNRNESQTISKEGDSGSCVYHKESKQLIGMLLGGNEKFSFVLPLEKTLTNNNFILI